MNTTLPNETTLAAIDTYLNHTRQALRLPGLAFALVADGRTIVAKGYGNAGPDTPFILGSTSKAFTAAAVMQLVESQKVDLDTPIVQYLPWFALADRRGATITPRQLLLHISGIPRRVGRDLLARQRDRGLEQEVRALRSVTLSHEPGEKFEYSNTNYLILSLLIQVLSGEPYGEYIQRHLFQPLGMQHSHPSEASAQRDGLSRGYRWWFGWPVPYHAHYLEDAQGAAFLISSANDMARWTLFHLQGFVDQSAPLSAESLSIMHKGTVLTTKKTALSAMGWRVGAIEGESTLLHGGEVSNFRSDVILFPDRGLGVVILTNCNNGLVAQLGLDDIATEVARLILGHAPRTQRRLTLRRLGLLEILATIVGFGVQGWMWQRFWRSRAQKQPTSASVGAVLIDLGAPLVALWLLPRKFDMSWRGLRMYAPDLAGVILFLTGMSLVRAIVRIGQWLRRD